MRAHPERGIPEGIRFEPTRGEGRPEPVAASRLASVAMTWGGLHSFSGVASCVSGRVACGRFCRVFFGRVG